MEPIAPSKPKRDFLPQLGLVEGQRESEAIYDKMMAEARVAYDILSRDRTALKREFRDDLLNQPPFTTSQLSPAAVRAQVRPIYWAASPETKEQYDKGFHNIQVDGRQEQDNWVIQWCIFHTFRHVNKHVDTFRQQAANAAAAAALTSSGAYAGQSSLSISRTSTSPTRQFGTDAAAATVAASLAARTSRDPDRFPMPSRPVPVRHASAPLTSQQTTANAPVNPRRESRSPSLLPYDPVRDDRNDTGQS